MVHAISLLLTLGGAWLAFSGYWDPLLLGFGALSCVIVYGIVARMDLVDHEAHYLNLNFGRFLRYQAWLMGQIVLSNIDVAKRVLHPRLPISPTVVRIKCTQLSVLGRVIFANSITLTPGTVSIDLIDDEIEVHSLTEEGANALRQGEMSRRVSKLEKQPIRYFA
ncbi:MAG: Na+/H+ antiporter subunit E [Gammaproteobacteria bacterium]|nr:Na+/H+ antiporter subunit E [Gammaproteobacteria bacterium]